MNLYDAFVPAQNFQSGIGKVVDSRFTNIDLSSNFTYFFSKVFPKGTQNTSFLINDIASPSGKKYVLGPEDIRKAKFDVLCIDY